MDTFKMTDHNRAMFRVIVLFVAFVTLGVVAEEQECMKFGESNFWKCCKKRVPRKPHQFSQDRLQETIKVSQECDSKFKREPPACDLDICIATKLGYGFDDGTFNKTSLAEEFREDMEREPVLGAKIKENCIEGDLSRYGPPELCDLLKYRYCAEAHMLLGCQEWNQEEEDCREIKDLVEKCT